MNTGSVVSNVTAVFSEIFSWITDAINSVTPLFYGEGGLTFLGTLTIMGLGISIFFVLISTISSFLRFRG